MHNATCAVRNTALSRSWSSRQKQPVPPGVPEASGGRAPAALASAFGLLSIAHRRLWRTRHVTNSSSKSNHQSSQVSKIYLLVLGLQARAQSTADIFKLLSIDVFLIVYELNNK